MSIITRDSSADQENRLFPLPKPGKKAVKVDFNTPDISSNGGLLFVDMDNSLAAAIGKCIPDTKPLSGIPTKRWAVSGSDK